MLETLHLLPIPLPALNPNPSDHHQHPLPFARRRHNKPLFLYFLRFATNSPPACFRSDEESPLRPSLPISSSNSPSFHVALLSNCTFGVPYHSTNQAALRICQCSPFRPGVSPLWKHFGIQSQHQTFYCKTR